MNLLAIETATEACSVALIHGDELIARSEIAPRRHTELMLPTADALKRLLKPVSAGMRWTPSPSVVVPVRLPACGSAYRWHKAWRWRWTCR